LSAMTRHIERLCRDADITWRPCLQRVDRAFSLSLVDCELFDIPREIVTAPIRSVFSYATALHEIGHYYQRSKNSMTCERRGLELGARQCPGVDRGYGTLRGLRPRNPREARSRKKAP